MTAAITRRGQCYEIIGERAHIRLDGEGTIVYALRTNCRTCGDQFIATCGPKDLQEPTRYLTRRCPDCRPRQKPRTVRPKCPSCGQRMPEART